MLRVRHLWRVLFAPAVALTVALAACGPAAPTLAPASPSADLVVESAAGAELRFVPDQPMTASGVHFSLLFRNASTVSHNLTFSDLAARTDTIVAPGASQMIQVTVPGPGSYGFLCTIHPGMNGALMVH